jgi:hypothetical protein
MILSDAVASVAKQRESSLFLDDNSAFDDTVLDLDDFIGDWVI